MHITSRSENSGSLTSAEIGIADAAPTDRVTTPSAVTFIVHPPIQPRKNPSNIPARVAYEKRKDCQNMARMAVRSALNASRPKRAYCYHPAADEHERRQPTAEPKRAAARTARSSQIIYNYRTSSVRAAIARAAKRPDRCPATPHPPGWRAYEIQRHRSVRVFIRQGRRLG